MLLDIIKIAANLGKNVTVNTHGMSTNSMVEYTQSTRSEPITMVDHTIFNLPELSDLLTTLTTIYAAMYSQSFSIAINQEVSNIKILKTLDKINPKRSSSVLQHMSLESRSLMLPDYNKPETFNKVKAITMESNTDSTDPLGGVLDRVAGTVETGVKKAGEELNKNKGNGLRVETDAITKFSSNLTTGILFEVTVNSGGSQMTIPLSVRLITNELVKDNVLSILYSAIKNRTAKERYREWRAGGLSFWQDIILCRDILRENRKTIIKDQTGMVREILKRRTGNKIAGFFSRNPSISNISNILIVNQSTVEEFERVSYKKISDAKVRDIIFNNTSVMMMAVVNPDREIVTLYYHSLSLPTTISFRDLKSASKKQGLDPMEVLRFAQMGNPPRF